VAPIEEAQLEKILLQEFCQPMAKGGGYRCSLTVIETLPGMLRSILGRFNQVVLEIIVRIVQHIGLKAL